MVFVDVVWFLSFVVLMVMTIGVMKDGLGTLLKGFGIHKSVLSIMLIGLMISLPELLVAILSIYWGRPLLSVGNLVGANMMNIGFVAGGVALIVGGVAVVGDFLEKDLWMTIALVLLPFVLMADGSLSQLDGVGLLLAYAFYLSRVWNEADRGLKVSKLNRHKKLVVLKLKKGDSTNLFLKFTFAFVLAVGSLSCILMLLTDWVKLWGVGDFLMGMIFLTAVTALPEMGLAILAFSKKNATMVLSGLLGGVITTSTLVMGVVAIFGPVVVENGIQKGVSGLFLVVIIGLFWLFSKTKKMINRGEGLVLVGVYLMMVGMQLFLLK